MCDVALDLHGKYDKVICKIGHFLVPFIYVCKCIVHLRYIEIRKSSCCWREGEENLLERGERMKVYLTHDFKCFLTVEMNVSAAKLCIYKSTANAIAVSPPLFQAFSAVLNLGPNRTFF